MKKLLLILLALISSQSFGESYTACYSKKYERNMIVIGNVLDKGNALCMNVFLNEIGSYSLNCGVKINQYTYSISGKTRSGIQVNAEVNLKNGRSVIQGEVLTLECK